MPPKNTCKGIKKNGDKCFFKEQVDGYCGNCLKMIRNKLAKDEDSITSNIQITEVIQKCLRCPKMIKIINGVLTCDECKELSSCLQREKRQQNQKCLAIIKGTENQCRNQAINDEEYCGKHSYLSKPKEDGKEYCTKSCCRTYLSDEEIQKGFKKCQFHREQNKSNEDKKRLAHYQVVEEQLQQGVYICKNFKCKQPFESWKTYSGLMSTKCRTCNENQKDTDARRPIRIRIDNRDPIRREAWKKYYKEHHHDRIIACYRRYKQKQENELGREKCLELRAERMRSYRETHPEIMKKMYERTYNNPIHRIAAYKRVAIGKNLKWELSDEVATNLFMMPCYYCGKDATKEKINGIDKIVYDGDYIEDNVLACCKVCNMMKNCLDLMVFICRCIHISEYYLTEGETKLYPLSSFDSKSHLDFKAFLSSNKHRGINNLLSEEEYNKLKENECYLCGKENSSSHTNGIDRIDSNLHYEISNCKSCCGSCNFMKNNLDLDKFYEKCHQISNIFKVDFLTDETKLQLIGGRNIVSHLKH